MADNERYKKVKIQKVEEGKYKGIIKRNTKFYDKGPESPNDIWVMTQEGDRLDHIANQYYGDPLLWWFIARANNIKFNNVPTGTTLRIPANIESINLN